MALRSGASDIGTGFSNRFNLQLATTLGLQSRIRCANSAGGGELLNPWYICMVDIDHDVSRNNAVKRMYARGYRYDTGQ